MKANHFKSILIAFMILNSFSSVRAVSYFRPACEEFNQPLVTSRGQFEACVAANESNKVKDTHPVFENCTRELSDYVGIILDMKKCSERGQHSH